MVEIFRGQCTKIQSPGMWSPLITTMNNSADNLINHEQIALYAGIQPRQK
jgi:hypothetical protein